MNEAALSIPSSIDHVPSKLKSDAVTVSELFGGAGSNGPLSSTVEDGYLAVDVSGDGEASSKKPKSRKRRKKKSVAKKGASSGTAASSNSSDAMLPDKMNVWGSQAASTATSSRSFTELQAEDSQRMMQQKRRRAEEVRRKAEEAMLPKQQKVSSQPPPTLSALLKDQQPVNVWASGGALKSAKGKSATKAAKSAKPKAAKPTKVAKAKKTKAAKAAKQNKAKPTKPKQALNGASSSWSNRASVAAHNGHGVPSSSSMNVKRNVNGATPGHGPQSGVSSKGKKGQSGNGQKVSVKGKGQNKATKNGKSGKRGGGSSQHFGQQNNRNIEAVNKVSAELQHWLRTEIKKLNPDVEAVSVAHLLLTLDDDTARTTAVHTFGNNSEVSTFIDSFLMHRSHDIQQQKHKGTSKVHVGGRGGHKKKKNNKSRR